ncbi:hypothetical protein G3I76_05250, partial [Streptomyces sp. SID11233]|nr:hypothetical protein [Streptomyces sp. SID11233]
MATYNYEIQVPAIADALNTWNQPQKRDKTDDWAGTAHALGRHLLREWHDSAPDGVKELAAEVEVRSDEGVYVQVVTSAPVSEGIAGLEEAVENMQVANLAYEVAREELNQAMIDAYTFDEDLSKNAIAELVSEVVSRPTALKVLSGNPNAT